MKKILISLMVIAVAVGLVGVSLSGAWYSDVKSTDSNGSNLIASGTVVLDDLSDSVVVEDLKPCQTGYDGIWVHNLANPGYAWLHIYNVVGSDGTCVEPEDEIGGCDINDIQDWTTVDLSIGFDRNGDGVIADWEKEIIIPEENDVKLSCAECFWIPLGLLETDTRYWVEFSFHIQPETGNAYQGDEATFDIEVMLQQEGAPSPDNEFPLGMKTIRLENKTGDPDWEIIPDDGTYGLINYWAGSDWGGKLIVKGLTPDHWYLLTLQGEWPEGDSLSETDQLLGNLSYPAPDAGIGYYGYVEKLTDSLGWADIALFQADANGDATVMVPYTCPIDDPTWGPLNAPRLPDGTYSGVRAVVKDVGLNTTNNEPDWGQVATGGTAVLYETAPMDDFTVSSP